MNGVKQSEYDHIVIGGGGHELADIDSLSAAAAPWFEEARHFDRVNQALYLDMQLLLSGNNLVKPDRMGMAVSIEARTPFLDWRRAGRTADRAMRCLQLLHPSAYRLLP